MAPLPKGGLLLVLGKGGLAVADDAGNVVKRLDAFGETGSVACTSDANVGFSFVGGEVRRYEVSSGQVRSAKPSVSVCKFAGEPSCYVGEFRADVSGTRVCAALADGPPWQATKTETVPVHFGEAVSVGAEPCGLDDHPGELPALAQCTLKTPGGAVTLKAATASCSPIASQLSSDGRYRALSLPAECGDYCYADVLVIDEREGRLLETVPGVEVSERVEWAPTGSKLLIGSELHDAASPGWKKALGYDACWLGGTGAPNDSR